MRNSICDMNANATQYFISKLNKDGTSFGNTIVQHLGFDRSTFALITYWELQPYMDVGCM